MASPQNLKRRRFTVGDGGETPGETSGDNPIPISMNSLPSEMVFEILARVPSGFDPVVSLVCKKFRNILQLPEIRKNRRSSIFLMFVNLGNGDLDRKWFKIKEKEEDVRSIVSTSFSTPRCPIRSTITYGKEVFVICGSSLKTPANIWVNNTQTGELVAAPKMSVALMYKSAGIICNKIFLIGTDRGRELRAQAFDLRSRTWEATPFLEPRRREWHVAANASIDKKVYSLNLIDPIFYDARDGSCSNFGMADEDWWTTGVCVIENVLFVYYARRGLMWYDSSTSQWKLVSGVVLSKAKWVGMTEYNSNLARRSR